jgi:hypothetical protein
MLRRLFTLLSAVSAVLCLIVAMAWVASYWDWGGLEWERHVWTAGVRLEAVGDWPPGIRSTRGDLDEQVVDVEDKDGAHVGTVDGAFYVIRTQWRSLGASLDEGRPGDLSLQYHWPRRLGPYWSATGGYDLSSAGNRTLGFLANFGRGRDGRYLTLLVVPCWALFVTTATLPAATLAFELRRRRRRLLGLCPACGYDLRASPGRCPECGAERTATTKGAA